MTYVNHRSLKDCETDISKEISRTECTVHLRKLTLGVWEEINFTAEVRNMTGAYTVYTFEKRMEALYRLTRITTFHSVEPQKDLKLSCC